MAGLEFKQFVYFGIRILPVWLPRWPGVFVSVDR